MQDEARPPSSCLLHPWEEQAMSQTNDTFNPFDPTGMLKTMRDSSMECWAKMMIQLVNSDVYAQSTATMLDAWLSSSTPFRKAIEAAMAQALSNLNMPSRADVISLAERLTNIEMRLDDLDARLEEASRGGRGAPSPKGRRTNSENHP
jgi:hypothetical protein